MNPGVTRRSSRSVSGLPIQFASNLRLRPIIVTITKRLQLGSSEIAPGNGRASYLYAHSDTRPMSERRHDALGHQSLPALVIRGKDEYVVTRTNVLAPIHRLLVERQRFGFRYVRGRGFDNKWHSVPAVEVHQTREAT